MMEDEDEYEEIIVGVEFSEPVPQWTPDTTIKMIGLDTATPIVQYDQQILQGKWLDTLGTKLFFDKKPITEASDPAFVSQVSNHFECIYKVNKVLRLKTCVVHQREGADGDSTEGESDCAGSENEGSKHDKSDLDNAQQTSE